MTLAYPPPEHVLRDLGFEIDVSDDGTARAWMRATPELAAPWGGTTAGVLATLADAVSGNLASLAALPDRVATADLALTLTRPPAGPETEVSGAVVRRGRTTCVVEMLVGEGGWATATFAVLAHRDATPGPRVRGPAATTGRRQIFGGTGRPLTRWIGDAVGLTVVDAAAGVLEFPLTPYVTNSFGALQGGMVAFLAEQAGAAAVGAVLGRPASTVGLQIAYLAQSRVGPFRTAAAVLDVREHGGAATVRVIDTGADDRVAAVAHVRALGTAP